MGLPAEERPLPERNRQIHVIIYAIPLKAVVRKLVSFTAFALPAVPSVASGVVAGLVYALANLIKEPRSWLR